MIRLRSISTNLVNLSSIIKYIKFPACVDCVHFIKLNVTETEYNPFDNENKFSKCNKFGTKDIISGKIDYDSTTTCRLDNNKCGIDGKYFHPISKN